MWGDLFHFVVVFLILFYIVKALAFRTFLYPFHYTAVKYCTRKDRRGK